MSTQAPPPKLFDRDLIAKRAANAWTGEPNFVAQLVADDLVERLSTITREFGQIALLGPDARALPETLQVNGKTVLLERFATLVDQTDVAQVDPEALLLPRDDYDLIISLLDLQIINDVPGFLARINHCLRPDGLFIGAAIGGQSLADLRSAWLTADAEHFGGAFARVAPFMDVRDAGGLLQRAGFALPVADIEVHTVRYASPLSLMRDLKALGAANPMSTKPSKPATKALITHAIDAYPLDEDGRISAHLELIWLSGWAPDDSQQKPLRPGSAQISLTKILGDEGS